MNKVKNKKSTFDGYRINNLVRSAFFLLFTFAFCIASFAQIAGDEDTAMFNRAKARDQQAIDDAINGWWTASMKTHDQRVAWWQEAKFGMFIHWGIYSLPGGEWKGKKVSGYAEHLMRKEQITRKDYLELAHQFNPVSFDAEKWISQAKKAGMKYFIITSKHHDGFAMFDSDVSDFTIIKQTPFKRDPMAELAAAAKKYGIKFGFYYSHAFDWEHPDAPGNDWEYNNPGGDKGLFGGVNWYDVHPELLPKAQQYVTEKAIPQIRELIKKYHPDILWFDTPQKLPLSENIRILKAIREADPNIVVNGRLVRNAKANFGDYKNTADRPAEFYPVSGGWEAIPTTNESYGYHKYDSSHKPVSHFIRLLASAASRGGNLLMNIGPKGDGRFDDKDLTILNGIGKWMDKNGQSIYGTTAGPLPLQSWGVSTLKGNKIYLHVFYWPANGKLYVGQIGREVSKAYFLTNPALPLKRELLPTGDMRLIVPQTAPDSINTVIVLEYKGKLTTGDPYFITPNGATNRLLAFDAKQEGSGFNYGDGKTDRYYVEGWKTKEQSLSWSLRTIAPARFRVAIKYLAPAATSGGSYEMIVDRNYSQRSEEVFRSTYSVVTDTSSVKAVWSELGKVLLSQPGSYAIRIRPLTIEKSELMKLMEIQLIPIDK